jgi:hypothetical protein
MDRAGAAIDAVAGWYDGSMTRSLFTPKRFVAAITTTLLALALSYPIAMAHQSGKSSPPPETWKEHWFEHEQLLQRVAYNDDVALYFDNDVPRDAADWMLPFLTKLWKYTKKTYGPYSKEGRLYAVFHQGRYSGGHPSTYFDASHDNRDVIDNGPGPWQANRTGVIDIPSHEVAHIVEGASRGIHESPAWNIWGDSKWAEFYQYDAYMALGLEADAKRVYEKFMKSEDRFPRAGTFWFRDWFYPLWRDYGHGKVMANYFRLLAEHFPTKTEEDGKSKAFSRRLNWGEYVHFMSGAARKDLKPLATKAFGWPDEWEAQYQKARTDFAKIKY